MGEDALVRFKTAFDLYQYIKSTMPMQDPDSMTEEKYLQVTAFLLAQNNMGDLSAPLTVDRAASMRLRSEVAVQPTAQTEVLIPAVSSPAEEPQPRSPVVWLLLAGGLAALASGLSAYARSRRNKPDGEN
jgi:hypothetical protein